MADLVIRPLSGEEKAFIEEAARYLERPSLLMKLADTVGRPLESVGAMIPDAVHEAVHKALTKVFETALQTIPAESSGSTSLTEIEEINAWNGFFHTVSTALTGVAGGLLGASGFAAELPLTTTLMFRSIARIAQEYGEDLNDPPTRLECMTIFSHGGGHSPEQESMESSYLTTRASFVALTREAARFVAKTSATQLSEAVARGSAPVLVRLMAQIASRFNLVVSQKFLAQAVPVAGALGGGAINAAFTDHFNRVARYHFGLRRLEREYGQEWIEEIYTDSVKLLTDGSEKGG